MIIKYIDLPQMQHASYADFSVCSRDPIFAHSFSGSFATAPHPNLTPFGDVSKYHPISSWHALGLVDGKIDGRKETEG